MTAYATPPTTAPRHPTRRRRAVGLPLAMVLLAATCVASLAIGTCPPAQYGRKLIPVRLLAPVRNPNPQSATINPSANLSFYTLCLLSAKQGLAAMAVHEGLVLDALDFALLDVMHEHPRAGALELSRRLNVARATVQARLKRLEESQVIAGYGPNIDCAAAGFTVQAFVTLEIAQGALDSVASVLTAIPGVLEAFATTGAGDVICRVAATSHAELQQSLIALNKSAVVARSTSVIVLSTIVPYRVLPLLHTLNGGKAAKAPAFRTPP